MNRQTVRQTHKHLLIAAAGATLLGFAGLNLQAADQASPSDSPRFERGEGPRGPSQGPGPGFAGDFLPPDLLGPGFLKRAGDKLNLTQAQRDTIKDHIESARPNLQSLREAMRNNTQKLRDVKPDAANYSAVVAEVSRKSGELVTKMIADGSQLRAQIWQVLTPEQRTQLDEMQKNFREHAKKRWEGRRKAHGPRESMH